MLTLNSYEGKYKLSLVLQNTAVSGLSLCQTLLVFLNWRYSVFFSTTAIQTTGFQFWVHHHLATVPTTVLETSTDNLLLFCCQRISEEGPLNYLLRFTKFYIKLCIPLPLLFYRKGPQVLGSVSKSKHHFPCTAHHYKGVSSSIQNNVMMVA